MSRLIFKDGDLLEATEEYIAHQCNCVTKRGMGLSGDISRKFPYADPYSPHSLKNPSTIKIYTHIDHPKFIGMFAQYYPGKPKVSSDIDTVSNRENWFLDCLHQIGQLKPASVAFPYKIGCGLAGGDWEHYLTMLREISIEYPETQWVVYRKTE